MQSNNRPGKNTVFGGNTLDILQCVIHTECGYPAIRQTDAGASHHIAATLRCSIAKDAIPQHGDYRAGTVIGMNANASYLNNFTTRMIQARTWRIAGHAAIGVCKRPLQCSYRR